MGKRKLIWIMPILLLASFACSRFTGTTPSDTPESEAPSPESTLQPPTDTPEPTSTKPADIPPQDAAADLPPDGPPTLTLPAPQIDPAAAITQYTSGQKFAITYIAMQDRTQGWAIAAANDPSDHILFTADGGDNWIDITPPEAAPTGGESYKLASAFFLDAEHAWVTYSFEEFHDIPQYPLIWYTADSGATWTTSAYLEIRGASMEFYAPAYMQFIDTQTGWLLASVGAGMSHDSSVLFETSDGGATWARIIDPFSSDSLHNCCKTGMVFQNESTGLVTSGQGPYTEPYVLWTSDGGLTWLQQPLPDPPNNPFLFDNAFCETHSPHFFDTSAVLVGVACKQFDDDSNLTEYNYTYTSYDDGDTWEIFPAEGGAPFFFFDENTGFIFGRDIYFTNNGGVTWNYVKTVFWDGQFSFVDRDNGWAVARSDSGEIALVSSADGGETWVVVAAEIVSP